MEFTNEEKEYIKKYEEKFHVLTNEEKEYIIKIKRENNVNKTKKELRDFFNTSEKNLWAILKIFVYFLIC